MESKQVVQGDLSPAAPHRKKWWMILLDILLIVAFVITIAVSSNIIVLRIIYDEPFYVNGLSMYPTLNKDALFYMPDKEIYRPMAWNDGSNKVEDIVDYGWTKADDKGKWMEDLHRYDIVVTYYPSDAPGGTLSPNADLKIKRLIGFPGETVTLEIDPENPAWGKTTITNSEGSFVLDNLYTMDDFPDLSDGSKYPGLNAALCGTWVLGEDEYFVMGDNRAANYSRDSRNVGPIPKNLLKGKAYVITGMRKLAENKDGSFDPKFSIRYAKLPWNYISLEYKQ